MHASISITGRQDGTFDVFNSDQLLNGSVSDRWLPKILNGYLSEDKRDEALRRLKAMDRVTVDALSFGKLEQGNGAGHT